MKFNKFKLGQLFAALALVASTSVQAHNIWIEPVAGVIHIYFGEYDAGLREKTGGKLDKVTALEVSPLVAGAERKYSFTRETDFLLITHQNKPITNKQAFIAQATQFKVRTSKKDPKAVKTKSMQYARYAVADKEPASTLKLDIQPVAKNTFKISFNGKPLVKTKVTVIAPNKWGRELRTDDLGVIVIEKPWDGLYLVQVVHSEQASGEFEGEKYGAIRYKTTLSIKK